MRRRMLLVLFALAGGVVLVLPGAVAADARVVPPVAGAGGNTWAGTWTSDFGQLTLSASGSGTYAGANPGTLSGRVNGNVLEGTWNQPGDPPKKGTFKFTLSADGRSFTGTWAYETGGCGSACGWSGTCVAGPCLKNGRQTPKPSTTKTPKCRAAPRLPASADGEDNCTHIIIWSFSQRREPIRGDLTLIHSEGNGKLLTDGQREKGNTTCGGRSAGAIVYQREQLANDDVLVGFRAEFPERDACATISPSWRNVDSITLTLPVKVSRSNLEGCPRGTKGEITIRAGKPFPLIVFDVCSIRHVFSPQKRPSKTPTSSVQTRIRFTK